MRPLQLSGIFDNSAIELTGEFHEADIALVGMFDQSTIDLLAEMDPVTYIFTDVPGGQEIITDDGEALSQT